MWSYEHERAISNNCGALGLVLSGDYPEAYLKCMSLHNLEKLVAKLVQCTAIAPNRPKWWPSSLTFTQPLNLGLNDEREIKLACKQLIVSCSQFFKAHEWNDENRERRRRRVIERKKVKTLLHTSEKSKTQDHAEEHFASSKDHFLQYFQLSPRLQPPIVPSPPPVAISSKLTNCVNIPFSSNVGMIMARREQHCMPEDLKLKRLERSEWYINQPIPRLYTEIDFETSPTYKIPNYMHNFKIPKRQQHHLRRSLRNVHFLKQFCTPISVKLIREDLTKVQEDIRKKAKRQLVIKISISEKLCCDIRTVNKITNLRSSPRLQNNL